MNKLYEDLPEDEWDEEEVLNTIGSSIALQMYYGNYRDGLNSLIELDVTALDFYEYLFWAYDGYIAERFGDYPVGDCGWYDGMLTTRFFLELARDLETHKKGQVMEIDSDEHTGRCVLIDKLATLMTEDADMKELGHCYYEDVYSRMSELSTEDLVERLNELEE